MFSTQFRSKSSLAKVSLLALAFAFAAFVPASESAELAKADLARRLGVKADDVKIVGEEAVTWTDGALGLPRPGEMVTKAIVPGTIVELSAKNTKYTYTTGGKAIRFGGPVLKNTSLLYVEPKENDPNLNGDLVQVSLVGTNPKTLIEGVDGYIPFKNGAVMATRRTSRSGFDLLYLAPGGSKAQTIAGSFAFGPYALDEKSKAWAAVQRTMVGSGWDLMTGEIGKKETTTVELPGADPKRVVWLDGKLLIMVKEGWYRLEDGWKKIDQPFLEDDMAMVLNRSQTLVAETVQVDGKPVATVYKHWWHGAKDDVAKIPGLEIKSSELVSHRWLLVFGTQDERDAAYIVDIASGMVIPVLKGKLGSVRGFARDPAPMIMMKD